MTTGALLLIIALLLAHFLGDFTVLASARVQEAKARGGPLHVILGHAGFHGLLMAPVLFLFAHRPISALIAVSVIGVSHFAIDVARAKLALRYARLADTSDKSFWTSLGFDQFLHGSALVWAAWYVLR